MQAATHGRGVSFANLSSWFTQAACSIRYESCSPIDLVLQMLLSEGQGQQVNTLLRAIAYDAVMQVTSI